jgi:hypothetical protein
VRKPRPFGHVAIGGLTVVLSGCGHFSPTYVLGAPVNDDAELEVRAASELGCGRRHLHMDNDFEAEDAHTYTFCCRTGSEAAVVLDVGHEPRETCVTYVCPKEASVGACAEPEGEKYRQLATEGYRRAASATSTVSARNSTPKSSA